MKLNKGVKLMLTRRKSNEPSFRISFGKLIKLGSRLIGFNFDFEFIFKKIPRGN